MIAQSTPAGLDAPTLLEVPSDTYATIAGLPVEIESYEFTPMGAPCVEPCTIARRGQSGSRAGSGPRGCPIADQRPRHVEALKRPGEPG